MRCAYNHPDELMQRKANLQLPLPFSYAELGRNAFKGYVDFFTNDIPLIFVSVDDEELQLELTIANERVIEAIKEMQDWFESILSESNGSYALGNEKFIEMLLATEGVDISIEDLKKIGEADLERNLADLEEACHEIAPDKLITECIEMVGSNKAEGGVVEEATKQLSSLKHFVINNKIVSIPGAEEALVDEAPPYNRWNFAYINIPGVYEEGLPSVYYIAPPDPSWSQEVQMAYIPGKTELLFVSVHEVWPGHFLHSLQVVGQDDPAKPSGGRDRLKPCHAGTDDQHVGGGNRSGRRHHHGEHPRQVIGRHEYGLVPLDHRL